MGRPVVSSLVLGVVLVLTCVAMAADAAPFNITQILNAYPSLSSMNQMLSSTGVADEINNRSSITVLVVANPVLTAFMAGYPNVDSGQLADLFRYHVLLQYLDIPELKTITAGNPSTITTLYQTTGRAAANSGSINLYYDGKTLQVGQADVNTPPNATIDRNVTQEPYNISILEVSQVVAQTGFGAAAAGANLTAILEAGKNFNITLGLLKTTGVDAVFAARETGNGITIFAPTDAAYNALSPGGIASATPAQQKLIIEYHALTMYYPLGTLNTLNNPTTPTVATTNAGAGSYLLNVSTGTSGLLLSTGLSSASVTSTLYDSAPTSVFAIDTILLPMAIFATAPAPSPMLGPAPAPAPTNGSVPAPGPAPLSPTPTPAPSPLSPSPTPTPTPHPAPAPSPKTPTPSPVPAAVSPGPPAPPGGIIEPPTMAPEGSPPSHATSTSINVIILAAAVLVSSVLM